MMNNVHDGQEWLSQTLHGAKHHAHHSAIHSLLTQNRIPAGRKQAEFVAKWFHFNMRRLTEHTASGTEQNNFPSNAPPNPNSHPAPSTTNLDFYKQVEALIEHAMLEVIRQVAVGCAERGNFLAVLWMRLKDLINRLIHLIQRDLKSYHQSAKSTQQDIDTWRIKYTNLEEETAKTLLKRDLKLRQMEADVQRLELTNINQHKQIEVLERHKEVMILKQTHNTKQKQEQETRISQLEENIKDLLVEEMENKHELEKLRPFAAAQKAQMHELVALRSQNEHLQAQLHALQEYKEKNEINKQVEQDYESSQQAMVEKMQLKLEHIEELLRKEQERHLKTKHSLIQLQKEQEDDVRICKTQSVQADNSELCVTITTRDMEVQTKHSGELQSAECESTSKRDVSHRISRKRQIEIPSVVKPFFQKQTYYGYTPQTLHSDAVDRLLMDIYLEKYHNDQLDLEQYGSRMIFPEFIYAYFYQASKHRSTVAEKKILDLYAALQASDLSSLGHIIDLFSKLSGIQCTRTEHKEDTSGSLAPDTDDEDNQKTTTPTAQPFTTFSTDAFVVFLSCLHRVTQTSRGEHVSLSSLRLTVSDGTTLLQSFLSFASREDLNSLEEELFMLCDRPSSRSSPPMTPFSPSYQLSVDFSTFALHILCKYWDIFLGEIWKRIENALRQLENSRERPTNSKKQFIWRYNMFAALLTPNTSEGQQQIFKKFIEKKRSLQADGISHIDDCTLFCSVVREEWALRMRTVNVENLLALIDKLTEETNTQTKGRVFSSLWDGKIETTTFTDASRGAETELDRMLAQEMKAPDPKEHSINPAMEGKTVAAERELDRMFAQEMKAQDMQLHSTTPAKGGKTVVGVSSSVAQEASSAIRLNHVRGTSPENPDFLFTDGSPTPGSGEIHLTNPLPSTFEYVSPFSSSKQRKLIVIPTTSDKQGTKLGRKKSKRMAREPII